MNATTKKPRTRILCPHCNASSSVNHRYGAGIENRTCRNGHTFEIDRWGGMNQYIDARGARLR